MHRKIQLLFMFSALLLTMCRSYDRGGPVTSVNGLSCQVFTDHIFFEWRGEDYHYYLRQEGAECFYACSDGTIKQTEVSGQFSSSSALYSASKAELDAQFCGLAVEPSPAEPLATVTPTSTAAASPTLAASPTPPPSPTIANTLTPQPPLLTGRVLMCDLGANLMNLRIVQPPPDLTGKTVTAQIAEMDSSCYLNQVNPSLLTCTLPAGATFPARIVVRVDGAVVNDFTYDGIGCEQLTTPFPTTPP